MVDSSNGPYFTWASVAALITLAAVVTGGGWTLLQTQLAGLTTRYDAALAAINDREELRHRDNERRYDEMYKRLNDLAVMVDKRRSDFLSINEFNQFQLRFGNVLDQLKVLESTRPTTGELQAATTTALQRQEERIRSLEQYLLGQAQLYQRPMIQEAPPPRR